MALKNEILAFLERHREEYMSGELLADKLGVTRTAVWKAVESLKKSGYQIDAVTRRGYRLSPSSDVLSAESVAPFLQTSGRPVKIVSFSSLKSTNLTAKQLALEGAPEGTVVIAEEQSSGSGRQGRTFFSPAGSGIYCSVILRPALEAGEAVLITAAAAVAVCRAVKEVTGMETQIKWVNDVYLNGRKICGILTEALTGFESGTVDSIILGIGLNFCPPETGFPPELRDKAGYLYEHKSDGTTRSRLAGTLLSHLFSLYESLEQRPFLEEYRRRSLLLGKEVTISGTGCTVTACAIDDNGGLLVRHPDGTLETLRSGEVSIRPLPF